MQGKSLQTRGPARDFSRQAGLREEEQARAKGRGEAMRAKPDPGWVQG